MPAPLMSIMPSASPQPLTSVSSPPSLSPQELETKEAFQKFVGGTFYRQLLKALRQSQGEMAYLNGGQAEKLFQSQMDEQLIDQLAQSSGAALSESLYQNFLLKQRHPGSENPAQSPRQTEQSAEPSRSVPPVSPAEEIPENF